MTDTGVTGDVTVDIICATYNGGRFVGELLRSLQAQTHRAWRLWVRDDGSTDGTVDIVRAFQASDTRIRLVRSDGERLGASAGFARLLMRVPADSAYAMCADQDDVWLDGKIARTLTAMREAEALAPGPVLVHTDLQVVDEKLRLVDPSFWHYSRVAPEPVSLRRLAVQNVVTGAALMMNRPLRELIGAAPAEAFYHDWWFACVAAAFGRIIAVHESTILYRQHDVNVVGARHVETHPWCDLPAAARQSLRETTQFRDQLARTAQQAGAFVLRYDASLADTDRRFLRAFARLPSRRFVCRKIDVVRLRLRREYGLWRNLGVLLRA